MGQTRERLRGLAHRERLSGRAYRERLSGRAYSAPMLTKLNLIASGVLIFVWKKMWCYIHTVLLVVWVGGAVGGGAGLVVFYNGWAGGGQGKGFMTMAISIR